MGWQDEAREVRDGALVMLASYGEWIAAPTVEATTVKTRKATVEDFQLVHRMPEDGAKRQGTDAKPYLLQVFWKGRQVAHMEWSDNDGPLECRAFTKGEWRDDMVACVQIAQRRSRYG
jgi:hypothetical protein